MHASDLQDRFPIVGRDTSAVKAARFIATGDLPGLVIADEHGEPTAVVSAVDVLGLLVPGYILSDLALAGVFDEVSAEDVWSHAADRTIADLIDDVKVRVYDLLTVDADATMLEVAAQMADARAQIALVKGGAPGEPRFITLPKVLAEILRYCDAAGDSENKV